MKLSILYKMFKMNKLKVTKNSKTKKKFDSLSNLSKEILPVLDKKNNFLLIDRIF